WAPTPAAWSRADAHTSCASTPTMSTRCASSACWPPRRRARRWRCGAGRRWRSSRASHSRRPRSGAWRSCGSLPWSWRSSRTAAQLAGELDPEALHGVLARFLDACATTIERHGGTVEQRAAEAAIGMFGLAAAHEDDALRALRAALELRDAAAGWDGAEIGLG